MLPLVLGLAVVVAAPAAKDPPKKDPPGIVGKWTLESATFAGMALPKMDSMTVTFTADGKVETRAAGADVRVSSTYTHDAKKDPPEMDVTEPDGPNAGKPSPSIYKIDGDTLTICTAVMGDRPRTFAAPAGSNFVLLVLKRVKD
jgi:uncharacterized protein (TIGR03067 family)